eukprot:TRINITY_DN5419_c0_g1_i2.p1 TRINITY_DN5419_c0_g1~~TRINITY_DN5419_c0_g1_i2.p1  ORF type:complete len:110 (+),score=10.03 TRINITY_DN5419_c0_g1_i2:40-369(+)
MKPALTWYISFLLSRMEAQLVASGLETSIVDMIHSSRSVPENTDGNVIIRKLFSLSGIPSVGSLKLNRSSSMKYSGGDAFKSPISSWIRSVDRSCTNSETAFRVYCAQS